MFKEKKIFSKNDTNIIKGMAIIFLMIHHCFYTPARYKGIDVCFSPFTEPQINFIAAFFKICLGMFVFITAYGITIIFKNKYKTLDINSAEIVKCTINRYFNLFSRWFFVFMICEIFCMIYSGLPLHIYGRNLQGIIYFILDGTGMADLFGTPTLVSTWWYMRLAITLVFVVPLLIKAYQKIGYIYMFALAVILSRQLNLTQSSLIHWMPAILLGIVCADKNLLVKISNFRLFKSSILINKIIKLAIYLIGIVVLMKFRQSEMGSILFEIKDGVVPVFMICFIYEFISEVKYINNILLFIGKYSMNIFLIHTIIRAIYFRKFIYGFKHAPLIVIVLLAISLLAAILVELLKKLLRYNLVEDKIKKIIQQKL